LERISDTWRREFAWKASHLILHPSVSLKCYTTIVYCIPRKRILSQFSGVTNPERKQRPNSATQHMGSGGRALQKVPELDVRYTGGPQGSTSAGRNHAGAREGRN
jgi:hypothetical protein